VSTLFFVILHNFSQSSRQTSDSSRLFALPEYARAKVLIEALIFFIHLGIL